MKNRQLCCAVFLLAAALLMSGALAMAQQTSGSISGVVQDSQSAVVPGAKISLINQAQGATIRELVSGADGSFVFTPVPPGTYTVSVEVSGFKKYVKQDIILNA
ncbi:MAG: TonB-dependent receptor plug, partial [Acidobacteria bacterium]|nr:TonB-dependent receptor plug [Acidobacteriota bacterium]